MADILTEVNPSLIENTTMVLREVDGNPRVYRITPIEGYVLHDKGRDWTYIDPDTMEETARRGYTTGTASCAASYDFSATTLIDGYTAYGSREFFARPVTEVPSDQIFGIVVPKPEIM